MQILNWCSGNPVLAIIFVILGVALIERVVEHVSMCFRKSMDD